MRHSLASRVLLALPILLYAACGDRPLDLDPDADLAPPTGRPPLLPIARPTDCPLVAPLGLAVDCFTVAVPQRRGPASAGRVRLMVAVIRGGATATTGPKPPPVVFLPGGPGQEGLGTVFSLLQARTAFLEHILSDRDLVVLDPRGTGFSEPHLACGAGPALAAMTAVYPRIDPRPLPLLLRQGARGRVPLPLLLRQGDTPPCADHLRSRGVDPNQYNTLTAADDVNDVRRALGINRWTLLGVSYGTRLALEVMRRHPNGVEAAVLDSVFPPQVDGIADTATTLGDALRLVIQDCADRPACNGNFPNLRVTLDQTLQAYDANPLIVSTSFGSATVDGATLFSLLTLMLYSPEGIAQIPAFVHNARDREPAWIRAWVEHSSAFAAGFSQATYLAVTCNDEAAFTSEAGIEHKRLAQPEDWQRYLDFSSLYAECQIWDLQPPSSILNEAVTAQHPTLLLSGRYDPVTPISWAHAAAATLPRSHVFEISNASHGVLFSDCGADLMRQFLGQPLTRPMPPCLQSLAPIDFVAP